MARLAHFFLDVDMRQGHAGLVKLVTKKKIKVVEGEYVIFLNGKRNIIKMFCGSEAALLHYKKDGRVIDPRIIPILPSFCEGKTMNIDGALREHLTKALGVGK